MHIYLAIAINPYRKSWVTPHFTGNFQLVRVCESSLTAELVQEFSSNSTGVITFPTQTICTINGKSLKITTDVCIFWSPPKGECNDPPAVPKNPKKSTVSSGGKIPPPAADWPPPAECPRVVYLKHRWGAQWWARCCFFSTQSFKKDMDF